MPDAPEWYRAYLAGGGPTGTASDTTAGAGQPGGAPGETPEQVIRRVAGRYGFEDPDLLVATARQESGLDARAQGDYVAGRPQSFGLFQENVRGRGAGLQPEQSYDVAGATERAVREFTAIRARNPNVDRGTWAALAQRPADAAGYARSVNQLLGRAAPPAGPTSGAATGATTAGRTPADAPEWYRGYMAAAGQGQQGPAGAQRTGAQTDEIWPVAGQQWGRVNNPFGGPQSRSAGATVALPSYNVGADLTARYGEATVAPVSGTIEQVYDATAEHNPNENSGWGGMTVLRGDNGYTYRLSHAAPGSIATRPGQRVEQGQLLQRVGISGNSTGPHLDLERWDRPGHFTDIAAGRGGTAPRAQTPSGEPPGDTQGAPDWYRAYLSAGGR